MINSQTTHTEHSTIADQTAWYSIGFTYDTNTTTGVPELAVLLDGVRLTYGTDYIVGVSGVQLTTQPEAGLDLVIRRDIPFTQEIDFQIGIIDPEQIEHGFDRSVMRDQELADYADWLEGEVHDIQNHIGTFGDVVTHDVSEFATAAQGAKADTAVQPGDLSTVATTGSYNDLSNKPTLGTAAAADTTDFATAAQGAKADTAVQPADLATVATTGSYNDLSNKPSLATVATTGSYNDLSNKPTIPTVGSGVITVTQGGTTKGTFNVNQSTSTTIALDNGGVSSVNGQTGAVVLSSSDVGALANTTKYGASLVLSMNSSTYVVTATLKDQNGNTLGSAQTIDLPLESVVVSGSYDSQTKEVVLTLESGSTIRFSVADLVSGLQTEITSLNMLDADLVDDATSANKFVTASEKALISTAVQPADLATVATTGAYSDLSGTPTLGTAAAANVTDFATAAQGSKADAAVQPADLATVATTGSYTDLSNTPTFVSSINSQTGAVTLTASDLGALPTAGGTMDDSATIGYSTKLSIKTSAGTNGFVFDETTYGAFYPVNANGDLGTSANGWRRLYAYWINCPGHPGSVIEVPTYAGVMAVGVSTLPQASSYLSGRIVHYVGADNGGTKSGYFYKCVSDGGNPATYSWTQVDVQPDRSISYVGGTGISISSNTISVTNRVLMNKADGSGSVNIDGSWGVTANYAINVGGASRAGNNGTAVGYGAYTTSDYTTLVGSHATGTATWGTAIGSYAGVGATGAIQLGSNGSTTGPTNSDANTFKVANANGNFEIMSADGTIPADRLTHAINKYSTMPTAGAGNAGWIVQFTGTTDSTYTHGYIYECVSAPSSAVAISSNPDVTVSVNVTTFETQITTTGQYVFEYDAGTDAWYDSNNNMVVLADYGITKEGVSISQDTITIDYTAAGYAWAQMDVQPSSGGSVNSVNGQTGTVVLGAQDVGAVSTSGGTVSGLLTCQNANGAAFSVNGVDGFGGSFYIEQRYGVTEMYHSGDLVLTSSGGTIRTMYDNTDDLGSQYYKWRRLYAHKLNNGGDIDIPNTSGVIAVQETTMPSASGSLEGQIVQFVGTTDANYTNGYFYKCVFSTPSSISVTQTGGSGISNVAVNKDTYEAALLSRYGFMTNNALVDCTTTSQYSTALPDISDFYSEFVGSFGTSGTYDDPSQWGVSYDGTPAPGDEFEIVYSAPAYAWVRVDVQPSSGGSSYTAGTGIDITNDVISVENPVYVTTDGSGHKGVTIGRPLLSSGGDGAVIIGAYNMRPVGRSLSGAVVIGRDASTQWGGCVAIGGDANASGDVSIAIGYDSTASGAGAIQLGYNGTNADANTFKVSTLAGNFEIMSADGTIPEARLADTTNAAQGQVLTLDSNLNAVWQASSGGGLPSQTGQSGKFLTTDGTDASWATISALSTSGGTMTGSIHFTQGGVNGGYIAAQSGYLRIGNGASASANDLFIATANKSIIFDASGWKIGSAQTKLDTLYATKIYNGANISVPTDAGTMVVANYTGASQGNVLTLDSNLKPVWSAPSGGGSTSATATLAVNDWSSNTQTVNVTGVTANNNVIVAAAPASQADYTAAGILCTAQGAGTLTFTCTTTPSSAITVNVLII